MTDPETDEGTEADTEAGADDQRRKSSEEDGPGRKWSDIGDTSVASLPGFEDSGSTTPSDTSIARLPEGADFGDGPFDDSERTFETESANTNPTTDRSPVSTNDSGRATDRVASDPTAEHDVQRLPADNDTDADEGGETGTAATNPEPVGSPSDRSGDGPSPSSPDEVAVQRLGDGPEEEWDEKRQREVARQLWKEEQYAELVRLLQTGKIDIGDLPAEATDPESLAGALGGEVPSLEGPLEGFDSDGSDRASFEEAMQSLFGDGEQGSSSERRGQRPSSMTMEKQLDATRGFTDTIEDIAPSPPDRGMVEGYYGSAAQFFDRTRAITPEEAESEIGTAERFTMAAIEGLGNDAAERRAERVEARRETPIGEAVTGGGLLPEKNGYFGIDLLSNRGYARIPNGTATFFDSLATKGVQADGDDSRLLRTVEPAYESAVSSFPGSPATRGVTRGIGQLVSGVLGIPLAAELGLEVASHTPTIIDRPKDTARAGIGMTAHGLGVLGQNFRERPVQTTFSLATQLAPALATGGGSVLGTTASKAGSLSRVARLSPDGRGPRGGNNYQTPGTESISNSETPERRLLTDGGKGPKDYDLDEFQIDEDLRAIAQGGSKFDMTKKDSREMSEIESLETDEGKVITGKKGNMDVTVYDPEDGEGFMMDNSELDVFTELIDRGADENIESPKQIRERAIDVAGSDKHYDYATEHIPGLSDAPDGVPGEYAVAEKINSLKQIKGQLGEGELLDRDYQRRGLTPVITAGKESKIDAEPGDRGIDGLAIKTDSNGNIEQLYITEGKHRYKSGEIDESVLTENVGEIQMSDVWIRENIDTITDMLTKSDIDGDTKDQIKKRLKNGKYQKELHIVQDADHNSATVNPDAFGGNYPMIDRAILYKVGYVTRK